MKAINVLLSILVSLALSLLVFEFGLSCMPAFRSQVKLNQFDARFGWVKKPNHSGRRSSSEFEIHFATNAQGLREPEDTPKAKPENTFRVLLLGDSFVLGYTVEEREVFGSLLEAQWRAEGRSVEVINAGTEGYSSDQEVAWLSDEGLGYDPDLVLLFPYENDIYWNGQSEYNGSPKPRFGADGTREPGELVDRGKHREWHQEWAIGRFLRFLSRALIGSQVRAERGFQLAGVEGRILNEFAPLVLQAPGFLEDCEARTVGTLDAFRQLCAAEKIEAIVVPIPSESAIHPEEREAFRTSEQGLRGLAAERWSPDKPLDMLIEASSAMGLKTLDARAALRERGLEEPLYFKHEWHLNPAGNRALAAFLHAELDRMGVVPGRALAEEFDPPVAREESQGAIPTAYFVFAALWVFLGTAFRLTYRDEKLPLVLLKVGGLLAFVFGLVLGSAALLERYPGLGTSVGIPLVLLFAGFLLYKLGRRIATIMELLQAFTLRGHWYLMPLVMVLLSIGSLLVVAASSPLIAPFIYTLF